MSRSAQLMNTRELDSPSERMAEAEEIKKKLSVESARDRDLEWTRDEMCTKSSWMVTPGDKITCRLKMLAHSGLFGCFKKQKFGVYFYPI